MLKVWHKWCINTYAGCMFHSYCLFIQKNQVSCIDMSLMEGKEADIYHITEAEVCLGGSVMICVSVWNTALLSRWRLLVSPQDSSVLWHQWRLCLPRRSAETYPVWHVETHIPSNLFILIDLPEKNFAFICSHESVNLLNLLYVIVA